MHSFVLGKITQLSKEKKIIQMNEAWQKDEKNPAITIKLINAKRYLKGEYNNA